MSNTTLNTCESKALSSAYACRTRRPAYDVNENEDGFRLRVQLPGVSRDGVELSIADSILSIQGTVTKSEQEGWRAIRRELPTGDFRLNLRLNSEINEAKIVAKVADGVLDLDLPKADEVKPRKIEIS